MLGIQQHHIKSSWRLHLLLVAVVIAELITTTTAFTLTHRHHHHHHQTLLRKQGWFSSNRMINGNINTNHNDNNINDDVNRNMSINMNRNGNRNNDDVVYDNVDDDNDNDNNVSPRSKRRKRNNQRTNNDDKADIKVQSIGNRILNPNHILLPSYFPHYDDGDNDNLDTSTATKEKSKAAKNADIEIPLQRAIVELTKSMEQIVQFEQKIINHKYQSQDEYYDLHDSMEELEFILGSNGSNNGVGSNDKNSNNDEKDRNIFNFDYTNDNEDDKMVYDRHDYNVEGDDTNGANGTNGGTQKTSNNADVKFYTIRVEQPLSHPVDPLCWLHANVNTNTQPRYGQSYRRGVGLNNNLDNDNDPAVIYLANAENTVEAGVYGSSYTIHHLNDNDKDNDNDNNYSPWDIIQNLPMGSRVIGGARFDKELQSDLIGEEWKEFGKEMWILPAIELRQEKKSLFNTKSHDDGDDENDNDVNNNQHTENDQHSHGDRRTTTLSINLHFTSVSTLMQSAKHVLNLLNQLSHTTSPPVPDTRLPPILSRGCNANAQEVFEKGVNAALELFQNGHNGKHSDRDMCTTTNSSIYEESSLQKVVLARRSDLQFGTEVSGLDLMMKLRFGGNIGGHLFYMNPGKNAGKEFLGCAPERLFQVRRDDKMVFSEALAGTRPRGSTLKEDKELLDDLMYSKKDRSENMITGKFIKNAFNALKDEELLVNEDGKNSGNFDEDDDADGRFFVRRLRHLQHICQSIEGVIKDQERTVDISKSLLQKLHPTPAVCGYPGLNGLEFIRQYETSHFDRGMYAGPFGYIGRDFTDIVVAIRSGLLSKNSDGSTTSKLSIYAGAGVVPGSTVQGEWSETGYKLGVLSSFFAQSPLTLRSFPTSNEAWATSFVEELIRSGVTQYYICPGSRSTPLTAALARAMRTRIGVIDCISVHDERAAAFRALGYGKATGRTAAVITSSGTAVANLYPAVIESSMDGVPLLLLTADRPYENRDIGANQAIDQVKVFSETYTRWFRDIAPPSDDIPISLALSDANHAATIAQEMLGPVHLNIQFRENLAPEGGPIRGDNRDGSMTSFSASRFTDVPRFQQWSIHGKQWTKFYGAASLNYNAFHDVATLIAHSERGIIVVGNIRNEDASGSTSHSTTISAMISDFATFTGFPVFAGAQSADIRFQSSAVVPYAEHLLKHSAIKSNIQPDLVIQIGSTLVSTEIEDLIKRSMQKNRRLAHVLLHTHRPTERADPSGTVTHKINSDVASFLPQLREILESQGFKHGGLGNQLSPLVHLGREVGKHMPSIIHEATVKVRNSKKRVWDGLTEEETVTLAEPEIVLAMSEVMCDMNRQQRMDLFLSNSMPVRDSEFFLYPTNDYIESSGKGRNECLGSVAVNRGASGIDGIISTATGYVEATSSPTTLLIGDLATMHDLNAFHYLSSRSKKSLPPLTTIIINNDGGGIFSFLPISKFGNDVGFEDFFGTPTNSFSFGKGAEAFGLPYEKASNFNDFKKSYNRALLTSVPTIIEAEVVGREENVHVHKEITDMTMNAIDEILAVEEPSITHSKESRLPAKLYKKDEIKDKVGHQEQIQEPVEQKDSKTLVLLHGWMGDKNEWDKVAMSLMQELPDNWRIISIDLPGHGETTPFYSWPKQTLRNMLNLDSTEGNVVVENGRSTKKLSVETIAETVLKSLFQDYGLTNIDALAGYSLGGRIALSMKKLCSYESSSRNCLVSDNTKLILLGSYPGDFDSTRSPSQAIAERLKRKLKDEALSKELLRVYENSLLSPNSLSSVTKMWTPFLTKWYGNSFLWADFESRDRGAYQDMAQRRIQALTCRAPDFAYVLEMCSPARNSDDDWKYIYPKNTYFLAGQLDKKYSKLGKQWANIAKSLKYQEIENTGHALLVEASDQVSEVMVNILSERAIKTYRANAATDETDLPLPRSQEKIKEEIPVVMNEFVTQLKPYIFDMELFMIEMSGNKNSKGVKGIGWGEEGKTSNKISERKGYIISITSDDGRFVGIGEVSPLHGVHSEDLNDVKEQLKLIQDAVFKNQNVPVMECEKVLALDGSMGRYIDTFIQALSMEHLQFNNILSSVRSGLEMSLMSLASEAVRSPLPRALMLGLPPLYSNLLPINGLLARGENTPQMQQGEKKNDISYSSMKIKVGHCQPIEDAQNVINTQFSLNGVNTRADANRAWNESSAIAFAYELTSLNDKIKNSLEFIEEPLEKQLDKNGTWDFSSQVNALEKLYEKTGIKYALDESLADFILASKGEDFDVLTDKIRESLLFADGCAALVLKPTVLGMELSLRLAKFAHDDLRIGAVFTSTFESGIGLAFTSFLAMVSDATMKRDVARYPHGISTFSFLDCDTLSPPFESYVKKDGRIKIAPLGRAIYGLGLDEIRDYFYTMEEVGEIDEDLYSPTAKDYQAMSLTSGTGREISIQASLPLPFSDDIACSRFTDLPQQPRWSPWLDSVSYLGKGETEWRLNVRGVEFRWKAMSTFLENPKGIMWDSTSGLKNKGQVEFVKVSDNSCLMKMKMTIITPRLIGLVFKTTGELVKEFVETKLLKWSLESFRDVVKADLALERGDADLGDALYGAVEGRSNAIEATLSYQNVEDIS